MSQGVDSTCGTGYEPEGRVFESPRAHHPSPQDSTRSGHVLASSLACLGKPEPQPELLGTLEGKAVHLVGHFPLHLVDDMIVHVRRGDDSGVPEQLLHRTGVNTLHQKQNGSGNA